MSQQGLTKAEKVQRRLRTIDLCIRVEEEFC